MMYEQINGRMPYEMVQLQCTILLNEVKEKVSKLRSYGVGNIEIEAALHEKEEVLSPLNISKDYKLFLGDDRKEIHLEPLIKAVYLLFLNHPEGILFKCLPDYREELAKIYAKLRPCGLTDRALRSIEDVTNPLLNSINEKCARIRAAFVKEFDESLAKNYYIIGERGEAKRITLPRDLVVWEAM
jgi:hypothetical protein